VLALLVLGRGRGRVKVVTVVRSRGRAYSSHFCGAEGARNWVMKVRQVDGSPAGAGGVLRCGGGPWWWSGGSSALYKVGFFFELPTGEQITAE
jgi:hypothetical protein